MTKDELKAKYSTVYRTLHRERAMRDRVFREGHPQREAKLAEMDVALAILEEMKDEIKRGMEPDFEQPVLLDVPKRATYQ